MILLLYTQNTMKKDARWWDFITIIFLAFTVLLPSIRLSNTNWTDHLEGTTYLAFLGLILGLALGTSRFKPKWVVILSVIYTLFFIPSYLGTTLPDKTIWQDRLIALFDRLSISWQQLIQRQPTTDSIIFLTSMLLVFWLTALSAGYLITRNGRPWVPLGASAIAMFLIEYYIQIYLPEEKSSTYIVLFVISALMIITQVYFLNTTQRWRASGIEVDGSTRSGLFRASLITIIAILLITWNLPQFTRLLTPGSDEFTQMNNRWDRFAIKFKNFIAPLSSPQYVEMNYAANTEKLGSGQPLSDTEVFQVQTSLPTSANTTYYWRARSYDEYSNGQWRSTVTIVKDYNPDQGDIPLGNYLGRTPVKTTVTARSNLRTIYLPGMPANLNIPSDLLLESQKLESITINTITVSPLISDGQSYQSRISLARPSITLLRSAGTAYPQEILDRYLQLPPNFPNRIKNLAENITADQSTPYDKALAITNYLRQEITYTTTVASTPVGRDPVDWFLFRNKEGFCQYYASAEVLMLRSIGIPARYSIGFAQGLPDETNTFFSVREQDRHAWPEVYFPTIGWVEFEPTGSLAPIVRTDDTANPIVYDPIEAQTDGPDDDKPAKPDPGIQDNTRSDSTPNSSVKLTFWLIGIITLAFISIPLILFLPRNRLGRFIPWLSSQLQRRRIKLPPWLISLSRLDNQTANPRSNAPLPVWLIAWMQKHQISIPVWLQKWAHWSQMDPFERAFSNVSWALVRMNEDNGNTLTPSERVNRLIDILPECKTVARQLLTEYELASYSTRGGDIDIATRAGYQIRRMARKVWIDNLLGNDRPPHH